MHAAFLPWDDFVKTNVVSFLKASLIVVQLKDQELLRNDVLSRLMEYLQAVLGYGVIGMVVFTITILVIWALIFQMNGRRRDTTTRNPVRG